MKTWLVAICLIISFFLAGFAFLATFWLAFSKSGGSDFVFAFAARILYAVPAGLLGVLLTWVVLRLYPKNGPLLTIPTSLVAGALCVLFMVVVENSIYAHKNQIYHASVAEQGEKNWNSLQSLGFPKLANASYKGEMFPPEGTSIVLDTDLPLDDAIADVRTQVSNWDEMRLGSRHYFGRLDASGQLDRIVVYDSPTGTKILVQRVPADAVLHQTIDAFAASIQASSWEKASGLLSASYSAQIGGADGLKQLILRDLPPMKSNDAIEIGTNGPQDDRASYVLPSDIYSKEFLFIALEKKTGLWRIYKLEATDWKGAEKLNRSLGSESATNFPKKA